MNYLDGSCECVGTVYRASTHACPCVHVKYNLSVKPYAWKRKKGRYVEGENARIVRLFGKWAPYVPACALCPGACFRKFRDVLRRPGTARDLYFKRCRGVLVSKLLNWICSQGSGLSLANCASSHRSLLAAQRGVHDAGGLALRDDARHRRVVGALYLVAPRLEA